MVSLKLKNVLILGIVAFLIISFWGSYSMPIDESGKMVNCPLMNGFSSFCGMNASEHIGQWKQLFTAIQGKNLLLFLYTLLVFLPVALFAINARTYERLKFQRFRNCFYWKRPEIKLFNHLVVAFSQGNIRSQIYA